MRTFILIIMFILVFILYKITHYDSTSYSNLKI